MRLSYEAEEDDLNQKKKALKISASRKDMNHWKK